MLSMTPWNRNLRLNVPKLSQFKLLHCQKGFSSVWWVRDSTVSEECCSVARWCWLLLSAKTCREHFHPHFSPISSPTQTIYFGCTVMMFSFLIIVTIWESKSKVSKSDKHYELQWVFFFTKQPTFIWKEKGFFFEYHQNINPWMPREVWKDKKCSTKAVLWCAEIPDCLSITWRLI